MAEGTSALRGTMGLGAVLGGRGPVLGPVPPLDLACGCRIGGFVV